MSPTEDADAAALASTRAATHISFAFARGQRGAPPDADAAARGGTPADADAAARRAEHERADPAVRGTRHRGPPEDADAATGHRHREARTHRRADLTAARRAEARRVAWQEPDLAATAGVGAGGPGAARSEGHDHGRRAESAAASRRGTGDRYRDHRGARDRATRRTQRTGGDAGRTDDQRDHRTSGAACARDRAPGDASGRDDRRRSGADRDPRLGFAGRGGGTDPARGDGRALPGTELPAPSAAARAPIPASISNAETVATPALVPTDAAPQSSMPVAPIATAIEPTTARAPSQSEAPDPAAVVALPGRERSERTGTKADVLAGWGWGTGAHEAITTHDDEYEDDRKQTRKRLALAIGGAGAAVLLIVLLAFAFRSDDKPKVEADVAKPSEKFAEPTAPPALDRGAPERVRAPDPAPAAIGSDTAQVQPALVDPPEPATPEPATPEPATPEPAKPAPAKLEKQPAKVAKADPPKKDPRRKEPAKKEPRAANKKEVRADVPKPIDPYAPAPLKLDAAAAYRTGLQQFARGDANTALATFKQSLASDPGFAPTWRGVGLVYEKLGNASKARTAFKRYLQLSPNAGDADAIRKRLEKLGS